MMTSEGMDAVAAKLRSRGYSEADASRYASLIGDTPEEDGEGKIVVRDRETAEVLARIDPL